MPLGNPLRRHKLKPIERGMVGLRKQRELDHLAVKIKQDALEKLFQELKHCRYLRLPYNEDDEKFDFISWVFQKD